MKNKLQITEAELKSAVSSTLRRQHLLSAYPVSGRLVPLTILAAGEVVAKIQSAGIEEILGRPNHAAIALPGVTGEEIVRRSMTDTSATGVRHLLAVYANVHFFARPWRLDILDTGSKVSSLHGAAAFQSRRWLLLACSGGQQHSPSGGPKFSYGPEHYSPHLEVAKKLR